MGMLPNTTGQVQINLIETVGRRIARVTNVEKLNPRYHRITLGGTDLNDGFPFVRFAPSDHVKLIFPNPETGKVALPTRTASGWQTPDGSEPIFRDYTVRSWNPAGRELVIDFVVHEHGIAGRWARDAQPGQELGVLGPRGNILFPGDYPRYIAAGDETAIPAISRLAEEAPAAARVTAIVEVEGPADEQLITGDADVDVRWVHRSTTPPGDGHLSALETAIRGLEIAPDERVFVFVAGETTALKPIRRYLRRELGLPKEQVDVDGYWKKGVVNLDHHNTELHDED